LFIRGIAEMLSLVELGAQALVEEAAEQEHCPDSEERKGALASVGPDIALLLCQVNPAVGLPC
jgi:hypothetical protein